MANVWEPIFAKPMLEMAKLRSLLFQVPNMQFSRSGRDALGGVAATDEGELEPPTGGGAGAQRALGRG
jgi:hypothetical protein